MLGLVPNTRGNNKTWNLWFRRDAREPVNVWNDFDTKWAEYRLAGEAVTQPVDATVNVAGRRTNPHTIQVETL